MQKKLLHVLFFFMGLSFFIQAVAQEQSNYKLALGLRLSSNSPTLSNAVSAKYFMYNNNAIEGIVSFGTRFGIGGLYEFHKPLNNTAGLNWYYGMGAYLGFEKSSTYLGPTGVIGLDYKFNKAPLNLSIDWKPELDILPAINFVPDAFALSARFVFK